MKGRHLKLLGCAEIGEQANREAAGPATPANPAVTQYGLRVPYYHPGHGVGGQGPRGASGCPAGHVAPGPGPTATPPAPGRWSRSCCCTAHVPRPRRRRPDGRAAGQPARFEVKRSSARSRACPPGPALEVLGRWAAQLTREYRGPAAGAGLTANSRSALSAPRAHTPAGETAQVAAQAGAMAPARECPPSTFMGATAQKDCHHDAKMQIRPLQAGLADPFDSMLRLWLT
jgi:hypothetical protein